MNSLLTQKYIIGALSLLLLISLTIAGYIKMESRSSGVPPAYVTDKAKKCIDCHKGKGISVGAVLDWELSMHGRKGIGCNECHIPVKEAPERVSKDKTACEDKSVRRLVSSKNCARCHKEKAEQFGKGKHALAWVAMEVMPTTKDQPWAVMGGEKGCGGCHKIGRDEGHCDSCHTRHKFSAAEARKPQACATCHMGFDHPQWEMYSTSKHGAIYAMEGQNWDWEKKVADWGKETKASPKRHRAPVCAQCHMPDGDHAVQAPWGFLALRLPEDDKEWMGYRATIIRGLGVTDEHGPTQRLAKVAVPGNVLRLTKESWQEGRDRMVKVCAGCHSESYAKEELKKGDEIIRASDKLMSEAITIVEGLYKDGVIPHRKAGLPTVDLLRFYEVEHQIEQKLYVMFLEHRMRAFQGAFHMNPDYMHWYGWAEMKRDLAEIKAEAKQMRSGLHR